MKQFTKNTFIAFSLGISCALIILGSAKGVSDIKFAFMTNGAGQSVITPQVNAILGVPMGPTYVSSVNATTTSGTLATSTVKTYTFSNVVSGALATSSVAMQYCFNLGATDVSGGTSLPANELCAYPSSTNTSNEMIVSWGAIPGAAYYDLYIGTSTGAESLLATTTATTFTLSTTTATSSTGLSLGTVPTVNMAFVDTINPNGTSILNGPVSVMHLNGISGATVATGTAAGAGATTTVNYAYDTSGDIIVHTGTTQVSSTPIFTVTFALPYLKAPVCDKVAESAATVNIASASAPYMLAGTTSTALYANTTGLPTSTTYHWGYQCSN